jgi:hypothetical protein
MKTRLLLLFLLTGALIGTADAQQGQRRGGNGGNGFYQDLPAETQVKLDSLRQRHRAEMLTLLTPEQRVAFEAKQTRADCRRNAGQQQGPRQGRRGN